MVKDAIRYMIIIGIVIAIVLVLRGLINGDSNWSTNNSYNKNLKNEFDVTISLKDKEDNSFISGAELVVKDSSGNEIEKWTSSEEIHKISKLKKGTYKLEEVKAAEGYSLNEEGVTFKVESNNSNVVMYNSKMSEEELEEYKAEQEKIEAEEREANTESSDVDVESTGTSKSVLTFIISIISIISGSFLIKKQIKKC